MGYGCYFGEAHCRKGLRFPGAAEQSREGTPNGILGGLGSGCYSVSRTPGSLSQHSRPPGYLGFLTIRAAHPKRSGGMHSWFLDATSWSMSAGSEAAMGGTLHCLLLSRKVGQDEYHGNRPGPQPLPEEEPLGSSWLVCAPLPPATAHRTGDGQRSQGQAFCRPAERGWGKLAKPTRRSPDSKLQKVVSSAVCSPRSRKPESHPEQAAEPLQSRAVVGGGSSQRGQQGDQPLDLPRMGPLFVSAGSGEATVLGPTRCRGHCLQDQVRTPERGEIKTCELGCKGFL